MTWKIHCFVYLLFLFLVTVNGDNQDCFAFNFEEDYDIMFDDESPTCEVNRHRWQLKEYYSSGINGYPERSTQFITPMDNFACTSSIPLDLSSGVLEINVHIIENPRNMLMIQVIKSEGGLVANLIVDFTNKFGWETIKLEIENPTNSELVIIFLGEGRDKSLIIDSIRHIPTSLLNVPEEDLPTSCKLYYYLTTTTTEMQTTTTETTTTETTTTVEEAQSTTTESTITELPEVSIPPTFWNAVNTATVVILCGLGLFLVILLILHSTATNSLESNNIKTNKPRANENTYRLPRVKYV